MRESATVKGSLTLVCKSYDPFRRPHDPRTLLLPLPRPPLQTTVIIIIIIIIICCCWWGGGRGRLPLRHSAAKCAPSLPPLTLISPLARHVRCTCGVCGVYGCLAAALRQYGTTGSWCLRTGGSNWTAPRTPTQAVSPPPTHTHRPHRHPCNHDPPALNAAPNNDDPICAQSPRCSKRYPSWRKGQPCSYSATDQTNSATDMNQTNSAPMAHRPRRDRGNFSPSAAAAAVLPVPPVLPGRWDVGAR